MNPFLLTVSGDERVKEAVRAAFPERVELVFADSLEEANQLFRNQYFDLCLLDLDFPGDTALSLLSQVKRKDSSLDVIAIISPQDTETAFKALKAGAYDTLFKSLQAEDLKGTVRRVLQKRALERENRFLRAEHQPTERAYLLGESRPLKDFLDKIRAAAAQEGPVLLAGEYGTGAEEAAWCLHDQGPRRDGPFLKIFCAGSSKTKLETDLFGRESGNPKEAELSGFGKLEAAAGGTLFLEQADQLPPELQDRLLRVFLEKKISRSNKPPLPSSIGVVASVFPATTYGGEGFTKEFQSFFEDCVLRLPPLRERKQDIAVLLQHFLKIASLKGRLPVKTIAPEAVQFLSEYPWPGNARELENCVDTMTVSAVREVLTLDDVPLDILVRKVQLAGSKKEAKLFLKRVRRQFERQYIRKVLEKTCGHQTRAAAALGLHRNTLIWKLKKLNLQEDYKVIVRKRREKGLGFRSS